MRRLRDAKKPGRVINISSVHEDMAVSGFATAYCCSKGGLRMLMRDLAVELGPLGITVNNVASRETIATALDQQIASREQNGIGCAVSQHSPGANVGTPEDVAGLVEFLASDDAAYITGSTFVIDGGLMRNYREQ